MGTTASKAGRGQGQRQKDAGTATRATNARDRMFGDVFDALREVRLEQSDLTSLKKLTGFDESTINALHGVFHQISAYDVDDQLIDHKEFAQALGLNPDSVLVKRTFDRFNVTRSGDMNFREFILAVATLSKNGRQEDKIKFSFGIYDMNNDGAIDRSEIKELLIAALSDTHEVKLTDDEVEQVVLRTLEQMDLDGNGVIEFAEYREMVMRNPRLLFPFTIDLEPLLALVDQKGTTGPRLLDLGDDSSDDDESDVSPVTATATASTVTNGPQVAASAQGGGLTTMLGCVSKEKPPAVSSPRLRSTKQAAGSGDAFTCTPRRKKADSNVVIVKDIDSLVI